MSDEKQAERIDERQERQLPSGVKLRHTLRGHTGVIGRIAWSPDGRMLASPSADQTIRLWDAETGALLQTLDGHIGSVNCVAWSPDGRWLAAGSRDNVIKIWSTETKQVIWTLSSIKGAVLSLAWSPDGSILISSAGYPSPSISLWAIPFEANPQTLISHSSPVNSVAWLPKAQRFVSGSEGGTVRIWDARSRTQISELDLLPVTSIAVGTHGRKQWLACAGPLKTIKIWDISKQEPSAAWNLEGHTSAVTAIAFSADGNLLASKSLDGTVRLWSCETWQQIAIVPELVSITFLANLAFAPDLPLLATVGSDLGAEKSQRDSLIYVWELDPSILLNKHSTIKARSQAVYHTTAKIVLVGDSGVGKTGLGWRLSHNGFKEHASTHGQQFWVLEQLGMRRADATECEAILWDLAGQPDYRLIHALFLDDADLALILFDPTDSRNPLHGVEFWLKQLRSGQTDSSNAKSCPSILIGARVDRGEARLTQEELDAFCQQHGISGGFIATSAKEAHGLEELLSRMKGQILWDKKTTTVTTITFKRIKDYVLGLKGSRRRKRVLVSPEELRKLLAKSDRAWEFTDDEMMTAVGHLANYGYVRVLRTTKGEERILLVPELLNNLAASFVLEARRNPKGLGALEEQRLLAGEYSFPELEKLSPSERDIMLDAAALLFLEHNICFRETDPLGGMSYLVFPELINLKKPILEDNNPTADGVAYTVNGAVENVYASLVVLLGYTQTFTRTNQWQNQARYVMGDGSVCGFRQESNQEGELELVLYFGANVPRPGQKVFEGLFESFLARRNVTVFRYEPVACPNRHMVNRAVVRERLRGDKGFAFCAECGERVLLKQADEPIQLTQTERRKVEEQRWIAEQRTRFEQAVYQVMSYVKDKNLAGLECFISYAWGDKEQERWVERNLATDLQKAGVSVVLDRWENARIGMSVPLFAERIEKSDRVLVVGTPLYRRKYENRDTSTGYVVAAEVELISNRLLGTNEQKESVLPLLLAGEKTSSLPPLLHSRVYADFRNERAYFTTAFDLILSLYKIAPNAPAVADLRESLQESELR